MSATIIPFPTQLLARRSAKYSIDVLPVDQRGFVILDACVPAALANGLMQLLSSYQDKPIARVLGGVPAYDLPAFYFEMNQPSVAGSALVEACVPEQLARDFLALVELQSAA